MDWIIAVDDPNVTMESLADSGDFRNLSVKLATAVRKIIHGELARSVLHIKENLCKSRKQLKGLADRSFMDSL